MLKDKIMKYEHVLHIPCMVATSTKMGFIEVMSVQRVTQFPNPSNSQSQVQILTSSL